MTDAVRVTNVSLWPALLRFTVAYVALSAVITAVLTAFDLDSNTGVSAALLVAATGAAAQKFVVDNRRALTSGERLRFAGLATLVLIPVTLIQLAVATMVFLTAEEIPAAASEVQLWLADNVGLVAGLAAFVVLFSLAVVYFSAGLLSRALVKRLPASAAPLGEG